MSPRRSARSEQTAQTRQRLIDSALQLFATQGYEETATDEIAAAAGVSPRTFFRYFPTKDSVLFFGEYDFIRSFEDVLMAQPPELADLDAIRNSLVVLAPGIERLRARVSLYERAIASSPVLRGRARANDEEHIGDMARAIARRRGLDFPDPGCRLLAVVSHSILRHALDTWLDDPATTTTDALTSDFALLRAEICGGARNGDDR